MSHLIAKYVFFGFQILGSLIVIKRGLLDESKMVYFDAKNVLAGCIALVLAYLAW